MPSYVAFLRAVNVGGRTVRMEVLKQSFVRLGFADVDTFIASGNVLFSTRARDRAGIERRIEARLEADLGYVVSTFVRTVDEVIAVSRYQAFPAVEIGTATALNVGFLAAPLSRDASAALARMESDLDRFHVAGREWYWLSRAKQSESRISNGAVEKALKVRSTLRGMNTIVRLASRLESAPTARQKR